MTGMQQGLSGVKEDLAGVKEDLAGVKEDLAGVKEDMTGMKLDMTGMRQDIENLQGEHHAFVEFARESLATKQDLQDVKSEIMTHVDGLAAHNQKFDQELLMMRNRQDRLEERVA